MTPTTKSSRNSFRTERKRRAAVGLAHLRANVVALWLLLRHQRAACVYTETLRSGHTRTVALVERTSGSTWHVYATYYGPTPCALHLLTPPQQMPHSE